MTIAQDVQLKQLEIELETRKAEKLKMMHYYKLEELKIQKEIAVIWNSKKRKKRKQEKINELEEQIKNDTK